MSLGKKILPGAGYRTVYTAPENRKATVNVIAHANTASQMQMAVTDILPSPLDGNGFALSQTVLYPATPILNQSNTFGAAVAINNDYCVIGAPSINQSAIGRIFIYRYNRTTNLWSLAQTISSPSGQQARFGFAVDVYVTTGFAYIVVGEPNFTSANSSQGRVYSFSQADGPNTNFVQQATFTPTTTVTNGNFGFSVAFLKAVGNANFGIGAPGEGATAAGILYQSSAAASGNQNLTPLVTSANAGEGLGRSLAAVSNNNHYIVGTDTNVVRIYNTGGTLIRSLTNPGVAGDQFGRYVGGNAGQLNGQPEYYYVGAPGFNAGGSRGRVYVYDINGNLLQTIDSPVNQNAQNFGSAFGVNQNGDFIVGAPNFDGTFTDQGIAYRYDRSGTTWTLVDTFTNSNATSNTDNFGFAAALHTFSGVQLSVIGEPNFDADPAQGFNNTGMVVFEQRTASVTIKNQILALKADQITDDVTLSENQTFERTGLVVDAGESVVILSDNVASDLRVTVRGFQEIV